MHSVPHGVEHSTRVDDNNLPAASACKPCHQNVSIPAAPKTLVAHSATKNI